MLHTGTASNAIRIVPLSVPRTLTKAAVAKPAAPSCSKCCLASVCLPSGLNGEPLSDMDELTRVKRRVHRGQALYRAGEAFDSVFAVHGGSFKTIAISRHGQEKVTGLYLPGEIMAFDAINSKVHGYDAIALEDSEVCVISYARLTALASRVPAIQAQLLRVLSRDVSRDQGLMLLLGGMDAEQRLASFLLSLSRRYEKLGYSADRFNLRMTREDIGSYLGLTLETVSRIVSRLQREGLLISHQRDVELKDIDALRERMGAWAA
jgi:CRP/FNR family transcriptional regulator